MKTLMRVLFASLVLSPAVLPQDDIRKVDFKNFTYEVEFCRNETRARITVADGEFAEEKEVDGYTERRYFSVFGFTYGDLDGDGIEEAVVISLCNTGGTGNFTEAYIYKMAPEGPRRIVTLEGGDRAFGGLRSVSIVDGEMKVAANGAGDFGGACCPEFLVTRSYKLKNGSLEETAAPDRKELYPAKPISFEKGSESATLEIELDDDPGIKRYIVTAAEGQKLTVVADSGGVRFRLIRGDADVNEESRTLDADLLESGDFTFEIRNFGEGTIRTKFTVTIRKP